MDDGGQVALVTDSQPGRQQDQQQQGGHSGNVSLPWLSIDTECQILIYTSYENHTKYRCAQWPEIFGMVLI